MAINSSNFLFLVWRAFAAWSTSEARARGNVLLSTLLEVEALDSWQQRQRCGCGELCTLISKHGSWKWKHLDIHIIFSSMKVHVPTFILQDSPRQHLHELFSITITITIIIIQVNSIRTTRQDICLAIAIGDQEIVSIVNHQESQTKTMSYL
jgi:hypothetical protein